MNLYPKSIQAKKGLPFLFLCFFHPFFGPSFLFGQIGASPRILFQESFSSNPFSPNGWTTQSINDQGPSAPPGAALWTWTQDGTGSLGAYWEERPPIASSSGGGAVIFNSDFLDNGGTPNNSCGPGASSCIPHEGLLISPPIPINLGTLAPDSAIGLVFNQYFRGFHSQTLVEISTDGGNNWLPIPINQEISERPFGGETAPGDIQVLNLMPFLQPGVNNFLFRFHFMGEYYFWIIDDVKVQTLPLDDITLAELIYPPQEDYCYFGAEELIKVEICNQGAMPQDTFFVTLEIGRQRGQEFFTLPVIVPLQPNECAIVPIDTLVDLSDFVQLNVQLEALQDQNSQNNQLFHSNPYQICQDSLGGLFVCSHAIIRFKPGTPPPIKDSIRNKFNATQLKTCGCDSLELWDVPYPIMLPTGPPILDPEEGIKKMVEEPDVEEGGLNYIMDFSSNTPSLLGTYTQGNRAQANQNTIVGVIDTGLDFLHDSIQERFWENVDEFFDPYATDNDSNCIAQDKWGYNLIQPDRIPFDDHIRGHGTHVSGIILADLPPSADLQLMTIKAMGQNGRGGLFELLCGSQYSIEKGAKVVNMSMGYTGVKSDILDSMISRLQMANILVVTSAGNDSLDNDDPETPHWPSNFTLSYPNVLAVAALNQSQNGLNSSSNFGSQSVDIAAPGTEIYSLLPGNDFGPKDGTSMAAAAVTRAAAIYLASCSEATGAEAKSYLLSIAQTLVSLDNKVNQNWVLNRNDSLYAFPACGTNIEVDRKQEIVKAYPNPFSSHVTLEVQLSTVENLKLEVFDVCGRKLFEKTKIASLGENYFLWKPQKIAPGIYSYKVSSQSKLLATGKWIKR